MKKIIKYMSWYTLQAILGPLLKLFEALLELFVPLVVAGIIDATSNPSTGAESNITNGMLIMIALGFVGLIFSVTAQYFCAKASVGFVTKIRSALFSHIQSLSFTELDKTGNATLITRITSDINQIQTGVNLSLRLLLRSPFVVFGAMIMAFTIDKNISLIFLAAIILLSIVVYGVMLITMPMYKKVQSHLDSLTLSAKENLSGVRVIRAFCKENGEVEEFTKKNLLFAAAETFVGKISALTNPVTFIIINAAVTLLIWSGAIKVNIGTLTQGEIVALYNYMSQILVELIKLATCLLTLTKTLASSSRIGDILSIPEDIDSGNEYDNDGSVKFDNVSFRYAGAGEESLKKISFSAASGETVGIIGGTGDGKTTLANLIPAFYTPSEGAIYIGGKDINSYSKKSLRSQIGTVAQKSMLFSGSIRDNIKWGKEDATDEEILSALEIAQAGDFVKEKDGGLNYIIEEGGKNLSGGQRQRLSIARAIVRQPKILILDDSSSALDYLTDLNLRRSIAKLKCTVFIVSQRASSVMNADKIIVLNDGEAVGIGTHADLFDTCQIYREIYNTQFAKEGEE